MHYELLFQKLVEENHEKNQRDKCQGLDYYFTALQGEVTELEIELKEGKQELIEFELVDILWTLQNLIERLHHGGKIDKNTLHEKAYKKYAERLPNIANGEPPITKEEQDKLWNEAKKKQKMELGL